MDRRLLWAIALMMLIAVAPSFFFKPPKRDPRPAGRSDSTSVEPAPLAQPPAPRILEGPAVTSVPAETVIVSSPLYRYGISTRGGAMATAALLRYPALEAGDRKEPVQLIEAGDAIHQLAIVVGRDTLGLADWDFVPSVKRLEVSKGQDVLALTSQRGGVTVELGYRFRPADYQIEVSGRVQGLGPVGGHLLVGLGRGMRQTESDSAANYYTYSVVTKTDASTSHPFADLKGGAVTTYEGPFEWVAVKSKYFAIALLAVDSGAARVSGVTAAAPSGKEPTHHAAVHAGVPVPAAGGFGYRLYVGPMEYPRLREIGHDFYDINPYGWPGFRTVIRPIAVGARWLLVWMHEQFALAYGAVLILFGILIRIVLWPLNQKGMRAGIRMQGIQPEMQRLQDKYKQDPQRLQQEMIGLYKREGVNPFSGCWPMLLPYPVLLALFFVLSNTIELRGQSFLWLPDLSLKDPLYIIPVLMGVSMFGVTKVGMMGLPPNPQSKIMLYFLPVMMTVLFLNFASGLNLYYFVQNVVSIPQQWYLAGERMKAQAAMSAPVVKSRK